MSMIQTTICIYVYDQDHYMYMIQTTICKYVYGLDALWMSGNQLIELTLHLPQKKPPQMGLEPTIPGLGGQCLIH